METALALLAGMYFAAGIYLVLADRPLRALLGVAVLAEAMVIALLAAGRLARHGPPILPQEPGDAAVVANPVPQAFAIVALALSFAGVALLIAFVRERGAGRDSPATRQG